MKPIVSTKTLEQMKPGEFGLIQADNVDRSIVFLAELDDGPVAVVIPASPFNYQAHLARVLVLDRQNFGFWPEALVFSGAKIIPDLQSAQSAYQEIPFSLASLPNSGGFYIPVVDNSFHGRQFNLNLMTGKIVQPTHKRNYWSFKTWSMAVPDPLEDGNWLQVFFYNSASGSES